MDMAIELQSGSYSYLESERNAIRQAASAAMSPNSGESLHKPSIQLTSPIYAEQIDSRLGVMFQLRSELRATPTTLSVDRRYPER